MKVNTLVHSFGMSIAEKIDRAMKDHKPYPMGQAELSRLSGVPQPTISRTLKGVSVPETETLAKLAKVLGITFEAFDLKISNKEVLNDHEKELLESYRGLKLQKHRYQVLGIIKDLLDSESVQQMKSGDHPIPRKVRKAA